MNEKKTCHYLVTNGVDGAARVDTVCYVWAHIIVMCNTGYV